ncbi:MAG TPA: alpha/beta hydrolase [Propionicimonas sp.]|jgi:pimeloyl-ACP methyl ester carboxylesterase|uniref:alpha/beta fold hydrolase n=1 Tax=Propionicimonas sp. TaxID=1955623 RepID=UPI002F42F408
MKTIPTRLAGTVTGTGEPAVLFVPGWCGDRSVFDDLVAGIGSRRLAMSLDLPGHGDSPDPGADYTTADVVDSLVAALDGAGVEHVVPVLLSHAGWAGIGLREQLGARVRGLVFLDWMVLGTPPGFTEALAGLRSPAWAQVRAGLQALWTTGLDNPGLLSYVASMSDYGQAHWARAGREISAGFARRPVPLNAVEELQPCPVLHLYAQPADETVLLAQQDYARTHPWFQVERLDARSHFPMFEDAGTIVERIERFVRSLG